MYHLFLILTHSTDLLKNVLIQLLHNKSNNVEEGFPKGGDFRSFGGGGKEQKLKKKTVVMSLH